MNYKLSFQNETYAIEDIQIPSESTLARQPIGEAFSFVSPVRLTVGQRCTLIGGPVGHHLLVNSCSGFTYSVRYLVSGIIATKEATEVSAV